MKITQADTPTIQQPSQFILVGTGTKYAGLHTQWLG